MTTRKLKELISRTYEDDFLKFEDIPAERRKSKRPDLHAFLLLDELLPGDSDVVEDARHDEIYLQPDLDALAKVITPEQVQDLVRCGIRSDEDSLCMFV